MPSICMTCSRRSRPHSHSQPRVINHPLSSRTGEGPMRAVPHSDAPPAELESLSEVECLRKLAAHHFGRLAIIVDGRPLIFPVNYAVCNRVIAIRTAPGTKLTYAPGAQVAFEID